jgi:uncharacterized protein
MQFLSLRLQNIVTAPYKHELNNEVLWLSPERCVYWESEKALILSDLHFGKTGHFRKSGIAVPQDVYKEDLQRLFSQIQHFRAEKLIIVGDLFHSAANSEMEFFLRWRNDVSSLQIILVKGNHDILAKKWYTTAGIQVVDKKLNLRNFCFTHDINDNCDGDDSSKTFTFSGHIHPGVRIKGNGRQALHFPCYYFNREYAVLPAFSKFTGIYHIDPKASDTVFALVDKVVMRIQ